jgi:hypothetical protein
MCRGAATCYTESERRVVLITGGAGGMPDYRDKPASAMAHGPAKQGDIERIRREIGEADARALRAEEVAVVHHRQRVSRRTAEREKDARI